MAENLTNYQVMLAHQYTAGFFWSHPPQCWNSRFAWLSVHGCWETGWGPHAHTVHALLTHYVHTSTYHSSFNLFLLHDPNFKDFPLFLLTSFKILSPWTRTISLESTPLIMLMDHHPLNLITAQPPFQLGCPYSGRPSSSCLTISVEASLKVLTSCLSFKLFRGCALPLCCRVLTPGTLEASFSTGPLFYLTLASAQRHCCGATATDGNGNYLLC